MLYAIEDDLLIERWLAAPRGVFVRLGGIGEGGGFGAGPAVRYNRTAFDVRASAAASLKKYTIAEAALRFPGTEGYNEYIRPEGPYVELAARHRDAPEEDFFGLGADSDVTDRSNYALRETAATVAGGLTRRNVTVGITGGHFAIATRPGGDTAMPSATDTFSPADVPGLTGKARFLAAGPFLRFQTRDRSLNRQEGGEYRAAWMRYQDQRSTQFHFDRWDVDLRQYLGFGRRTRTLALRTWAASASPRAGGEVPFYLQPWLGGRAVGARLPHVPLPRSECRARRRRSTAGASTSSPPERSSTMPARWRGRSTTSAAWNGAMAPGCAWAGAWARPCGSTWLRERRRARVSC